MELTFTNGNATQQALWKEALTHLLNLAFSDIPLELTVSFVDPSELTGQGHTDFASTLWTYDKPTATVKVRNDAPGFGSMHDSIVAEAAKYGLEWSAERFLLETSVHEMAHALYASLSQANRVAIAQMFGADTDDPAVLQPKDTPWQEHITEGIAETFKEAFLPRRFRVFPNRTNRKIPYHRFPEFRALWRQSVPEVLRGGEPLGEGEEEVPAYDLDIFKQGGFRKTERGEAEIPEGFVPIGHDSFEFLIGDGGFWDTFMQEVYILHTESPADFAGSLLRSEFLWKAWVLNGVTLTWNLPLTSASFDSDGSGLELEIFSQVKQLFDGTWIRADEAESGFTLLKDAASFLPPTTITDSAVVNGSNFGGLTRKCHGATYRWVELFGTIQLNLDKHTLGEHEALREGLLYPILAPFPFVQGACSGGDVGPPIEVPDGQLTPGGALGGSCSNKRPVVGNYR